MQLTKQEAEREAIRRWYELPEDLRATPDDADVFAAHIAPDIDFYSITDRTRLLAAWLMRELFRVRAAAKAEAAVAAAAAQESQAA